MCDRALSTGKGFRKKTHYRCQDVNHPGNLPPYLRLRPLPQTKREESQIKENSNTQPNLSCFVNVMPRFAERVAQKKTESVFLDWA